MTKSNATRRRGTTLVECIAAGAILAVLLVVCTQALSRTVIQQKAITNRRAALQTAANAMERVHALAWHELAPPNTQRIAQQVSQQEMLRNGRLEITVEESEAAPPAKRIRVAVLWKEMGEERERSQQLTAWRYAEPTGPGPALSHDAPTPEALP